MNTADIVKIILGSGVVGTLLNQLFTLWRDRANYESEYRKKIVDKRFEACEKVQRLTYFFSTSIHDERDGKYYHFIFGEQTPNPLEKEYLVIMTELTKTNIWLSSRLRNKVLEFNRFMFQNNINFNDISAGKRYYKEIGKFMDDLLEIARADVDILYKKKLD